MLAMNKINMTKLAVIGNIHVLVKLAKGNKKRLEFSCFTGCGQFEITH